MDSELLEKYFSEKGKSTIAQAQIFFLVGYKEMRGVLHSGKQRGYSP